MDAASERTPKDEQEYSRSVVAAVGVVGIVFPLPSLIVALAVLLVGRGLGERKRSQVKKWVSWCVMWLAIWVALAAVYSVLA